MLVHFRVVASNGKETSVSGLTFHNFGAHHDSYPCSYITAASAVGMNRNDVDTFINRLDQVLKKFKKVKSVQKETEVDDDENDN